MAGLAGMYWHLHSTRVAMAWCALVWSGSTPSRGNVRFRCSALAQSVWILRCSRFLVLHLGRRRITSTSYDGVSTLCSRHPGTRCRRISTVHRTSHAYREGLPMFAGNTTMRIHYGGIRTLACLSVSVHRPVSASTHMGPRSSNDRTAPCWAGRR
ncbi:hypothetical protein CH063_00551 [Colletotrichum higginsianum]|uniref:Secreted protein n=1 Tax=Colletotrichum higginsianum (strain IMI 349063) TaxID=759273 RepID=H1VYQ2_COLHI|nr:hypothetical protein CH063_00551 [Colletotrichum higginsianum]